MLEAREDGGGTDRTGWDRELTVVVIAISCWAKLKDEGIVGGAERIGGADDREGREAGDGGRQVWLDPGGPETGAHFLCKIS